jgi:hypothetical protein
MANPINVFARIRPFRAEFSKITPFQYVDQKNVTLQHKDISHSFHLDELFGTSDSQEKIYS